MRNDPLHQLLVQIHRNVDRVCEDLQTDRPDLAASVRQHASWIPRPDELFPDDPPPPQASLGQLHPLLYDALAEGVIDDRQFDVLMVDRLRAARVLEQRSRR